MMLSQICEHPVTEPRWHIKLTTTHIMTGSDPKALVFHAGLRQESTFWNAYIYINVSCFLWKCHISRHLDRKMYYVADTGMNWFLLCAWLSYWSSAQRGYEADRYLRRIFTYFLVLPRARYTTREMDGRIQYSGIRLDIDHEASRKEG
jgi:hypothetical protein